MRPFPGDMDARDFLGPEPARRERERHEDYPGGYVASSAERRAAVAAALESAIAMIHAQYPRSPR